MIETSDENIYVQDISLHKFNETNYEHIDKTDFDKTKMWNMRQRIYSVK